MAACMVLSASFLIKTAFSGLKVRGRMLCKAGRGQFLHPFFFAACWCYWCVQVFCLCFPIGFATGCSLAARNTGCAMGRYWPAGCYWGQLACRRRCELVSGLRHGWADVAHAGSAGLHGRRHRQRVSRAGLCSDRSCFSRAFAIGFWSVVRDGSGHAGRSRTAGGVPSGRNYSRLYSCRQPAVSTCVVLYGAAAWLGGFQPEGRRRCCLLASACFCWGGCWQK